VNYREVGSNAFDSRTPDTRNIISIRQLIKVKLTVVFRTIRCFALRGRGARDAEAPRHAVLGAHKLVGVKIFYVLL